MLEFIITAAIAFVFLFTLLKAIEVIVHGLEKPWVVYLVISAVSLAGLLAFSLSTYVW